MAKNRIEINTLKYNLIHLYYLTNLIISYHSYDILQIILKDMWNITLRYLKSIKEYNINKIVSV